MRAVGCAVLLLGAGAVAETTDVPAPPSVEPPAAQTGELSTNAAPKPPKRTPKRPKTLSEMLRGKAKREAAQAEKPHEFKPKFKAPPEKFKRTPVGETRTAVPLLSTHRLQELVDSGGDARQLLESMQRSLGTRKALVTDHPPLPPEPDRVMDPMPHLYQQQARDVDSCPNVIFMILDTLRSDKLGCYGEELPTSPQLDKLASLGVRFENVLSQCSWTRPSIGSMLTSRYPRELGIYLEDNQILADEFVTLAEAMKGQGYHTIGLTANPNINSTFNFHQGFDQYVDSGVLFSWMPMTQGQNRRGISPLPGAHDLFEKALSFVSRSGNEGPYYLQFNLMEVHEWIANQPGTNMLRREYENIFPGSDRFSKYIRLLRQMTDDIGRFVEQVTALPGWEDTIFVFTSDHGEGLGDHVSVRPSTGHGYLLYESMTRVPWIIYRKGWTPARKVVSQEVRVMDVMPTLLDMIGAPLPEGTRGVSMLPAIEGNASVAPLPRYEVIETQFQSTDKVAVYGKRFNYIENRVPHAGLPEFELQPRGGRESGTLTSVMSKYPEIAVQLREYLEGWEREIPRRPPTTLNRKLSEQEEDQLKAIGYLAE